MTSKRDSNYWYETKEKFEQTILTQEVSKISRKLRKQTRFNGMEHTSHKMINRDYIAR